MQSVGDQNSVNRWKRTAGLPEIPNGLANFDPVEMVGNLAANAIHS